MYSIDIETRSKTDIKLGITKYVSDPFFEVLIAAVKDLDTGEKFIFDFYHDGIDEQWLNIVTSDRVKWAYNAAFEQTCINKQLFEYYSANKDEYYIPPDKEILTENWACRMVHAYLNGGSGTLDGVNLLFGTGVAKKPEGKKLIKLFSLEFAEPDLYPDEWNMFKKYCLQDVEAETALQDYCNYNKFDSEMYKLHCDINTRGIKIDLDLIEKNLVATHAIKEQAEKHINEMGLINPRSYVQKILWFSKHGVSLSSTDKAHLDALYEQTTNGAVKLMIELLRDVSATSTSKYKKMKNAHVSGRLHDLYMMAKAGTHRFSSMIVQIQNLARGYGSEAEINEAMKNIDSLEKSRDLIRACFIGNLMVADFSGIEARVLAWLAQDIDKLERIRQGIDLYKVNAAKLFNVDYAAVTSTQRKTGKTMELALGYQGAVNAMVAFGADKIMTEPEIVKAVKVWRQINKPISKLWYHIDDVVKLAVQTCRGMWVNEDLNWYVDYRKNKAGKHDLLMHLPNGVYLVYKNARCERFAGQNQMCYERNKGNLIEKDYLYGGKLIENATQAVAYQLLRNSMLNLDKADYNIVGHVHDEIIVDQLHGSLDEMIKIMIDLPDWASLGRCGKIPVNAEGWTGNRYRK